MTTDTTARRHPAADPNPEEQRVDYRSTERLLNAVQAGAIFRDLDHEYRDQRTKRIVSGAVYDADELGYLALTRDGGIRVTDAGTVWLGRERIRGRKAGTQVTFTPPAVA